MNERYFELLAEDDFIMEGLPDEVAASIQVRDDWIASMPASGAGLEFFVSDLQRWTPGSTVRVAFLGGTTQLHSDIAEAAAGVTDGCNLDLDFGFDAESGTYRTWSEDDTEFSAEIRVSFDQRGYFSLVGTDSVDSTIGQPGQAVGGRPGQRSLNLGAYHIKRPLEWKGTVRHEFLHALAFNHEHQNFKGPCRDEFRWNDDEGYEPTTDPRGQFIEDAQGRRPGIYTFLAGFPNNWSKAKVDHNLRQGDPADAGMSASDFDDASVMLYRFPPLFYKTHPSACAPSTDGQELSDGDRSGLVHLYPLDQSAIAEFGSRTGDLADLVGSGGGGAGGAMSGLESMSGLEASVGAASPGAASYRERAVELLRARAAAIGQ